MIDLKTVFPCGSKSFIEANSAILTHETNKNDASKPTGTPRRGVMNKTEAEYALILEEQKRKGEILRWEFEGITLRFANVKFTPDFVVFMSSPVRSDCKFIEVKGPFCKGKFERAVERFRHAKTYYGDVFSFELHQKTKNGWQQII